MEHLYISEAEQGDVSIDTIILLTIPPRQIVVHSINRDVALFRCSEIDRHSIADFALGLVPLGSITRSKNSWYWRIQWLSQVEYWV